MIKPIRTEPIAEEEFLSAAQYYEDQRAGLGDEFIAAVEQAVTRIAKTPAAYALLPDLPSDLPARGARVGRFPYHVVFIDHPQGIHILAFAHDRRAPQYWRERTQGE